MLEHLVTYGRMIKFAHSIFALPFALAALVIVNQDYNITVNMVLFVLTAMIAARTASMGFNRIIDRHIDAKNPRTAQREIPSGKISLLSAWFFTLAFSGLFILSTYLLNDLCYYLSFPTLIFLFFYSYTKRFTWLAHYFLGFSIGIAPTGAWFAVTGEFNLTPVIMTLALTTYIAGFDILYALQDEVFDREQKLHSIPAVFGRSKAILISKVTHLMTFILFVLTGFYFGLGFGFYIGAFIMGLLLIYEHLLVMSGDSEKLKFAFFQVNGVISILFFLSVFAGILW